MLIVMDLDDTLLKSDKSISEYSINILKKLQSLGHIICFNSARCTLDMDNVYKYFNPDYSILFVGELILDKNKNIIYSNPINQKICNDFYDYVSKLDVNCISLQSINNAYTNKKEYENYVFKYKESFSDIEEDVYKLLIQSDDFNIALDIKNKFDLNIIRYKNSNFIGFENKVCDKGYGIKVLKDILKINKEDVISFGDDYTDISMFKESNINVAMENGIDIIKNESNNICDTNENDGVCKFLEKYFKL